MAGERILVVDDEPGVRETLEAILKDEGFEVHTAETGESALERLGECPCDAVLLDIWLPGIDGLDTLRQLRERWTDIEVVMISGHGTIDTAVSATKLGAFDFVEKPLSLERTLLVLRNALRHRTLEMRNRHLIDQLTRDTEIQGHSAAAERLRREVEAAAVAVAPVLISGESGSGREQVARRIHGAGRFAGGPFVDVPCATLNATALDAELFGAGDRVARIQLAAGGSLFLEDVDQLDAARQQRLAGQLGAGAGRYRPIASISADVAVLDDKLRQVFGSFHIEVPALRERREDIPLLAERFMRDLAREYGREPKPFAADALAAIRTHEWPGNVRALRNVVERTLLLAPGPRVAVSDLPAELGGARASSVDLYSGFSSLAEGVAAFERYYVERVLSEAGGDRTAAASRLGLSEAAFGCKLEEIEKGR